MATTFNVLYLGTGPEIDQVEGSAISENASALVGNTYGSAGQPLAGSIFSFSPGSTGYDLGTPGAYDTDNNSNNDTFQINGGADQTMDGVCVYGATITYTDGTTATISAVVVQDTNGHIYLLPESSYNADQIALEAKPIRSLTLDNLITNDGAPGANRYDANFAVCFTSGTVMCTPGGARLIDDLRIGDLVVTMDNGPQPIRWIGRSHLDHAALRANPKLRPILIPAGRLQNDRDLLVSPQHGLLLGQDHLVRATHAARAPKSGIRIAHGKRSVTYIHLMFDAHQIIFGQNIPSESFYPGPMAQRLLAPEALRELQSLFPDFVTHNPDKQSVARSYGDTIRAFLPKNSVAEALSGHFANVSGALEDRQFRRAG